MKRAAWEALGTLCALRDAGALAAARDVVREAQGKALLMAALGPGWEYQPRVFEIIEIRAERARMIGALRSSDDNRKLSVL